MERNKYRMHYSPDDIAPPALGNATIRGNRIFFSLLFFLINLSHFIGLKTFVFGLKSLFWFLYLEKIIFAPECTSSLNSLKNKVKIDWKIVQQKI